MLLTRRQVDVEQHQVGLEPLRLHERLRAAVRDPGDAEPGGSLTNPVWIRATMKSSSTTSTSISGHLGVERERRGEDRPARAVVARGHVPPRRRHTSRVRASPKPRPPTAPTPFALVV